MIGILLTSATLSGLCGEYGFDANHGKCHLVECDRCSRYFNYEGKCVPHIIINTIGIGMPALIVIISYGASFWKLITDHQDDDVSQYKRSTIILTVCYVFFIVPIYAIEFIDMDEVKEKVISNSNRFSIGVQVLFQAQIVVAIYSVYWLVYVVNVLIYVMYLPRMREAYKLIIIDIIETCSGGYINLLRKPTSTREKSTIDKFPSDLKPNEI